MWRKSWSRNGTVDFCAATLGAWPNAAAKAALASSKVPTQSKGFILPRPVMSLNICSNFGSAKRSLPKIFTNSLCAMKGERIVKTKTHFAHSPHHSELVRFSFTLKLRLQLEKIEK